MGSRLSPSTGGQGEAQPQQDSPQRGPGRSCAPAVPQPWGPLPSPTSRHFPSLQRGRCGNGLGVLLQFCSSVTSEEALLSPPGVFTAPCHLLGQRFQGIFKQNCPSSWGSTAGAAQEKFPEAPPAKHHSSEMPAPAHSCSIPFPLVQDLFLLCRALTELPVHRHVGLMPESSEPATASPYLWPTLPNQAASYPRKSNTFRGQNAFRLIGDNCIIFPYNF